MNSLSQIGWRLKAALRHGATDFYEVARYFVMGAFLAACLQAFIPRANLVQLGMKSGIIAIGLMMVLALCLNLCSEADAFIAASFRNYLPLSAQLAFMVLGPMLDFKLLLMYRSVFRSRMVAVLAGIITTLVLASMLAAGMVWK